jgi:hypothetical protein
VTLPPPAKHPGFLQETIKQFNMQSHVILKKIFFIVT